MRRSSVAVAVRHRRRSDPTFRRSRRRRPPHSLARARDCRWSVRSDTRSRHRRLARRPRRSLAGIEPLLDALDFRGCRSLVANAHHGRSRNACRVKRPNPRWRSTWTPRSSRAPGSIDANLNRASEGFRVAEDFARFVLEDRGPSERLKQARHRLQEAAAFLPDSWRIASRDAPNDVGAELTTEREGRRETDARRRRREHQASPGSAALARGGREDRQQPRRAAVRHDPLRGLSPRKTAAHRVGGAAGAGVRGRLLACRTRRLPKERSSGPPRKSWMRAWCSSSSSERSRRPHASSAWPGSSPLDRAVRRRLVINDRADVAGLVGADGVHVGQEDLPPHRGPQSRRTQGDRSASARTFGAIGIGGSNDGADYVGVGPVFPSKPKSFDRFPWARIRRSAPCRSDKPADVLHRRDHAEQHRENRRSWRSKGSQSAGRYSDSEEPSRSSADCVPHWLDP